MKKTAKLVGVYPIENSENIFLIEVIVYAKPSEVDMSLFVQKDNNLPESSWQTAYDEKYLNSDGSEVIGEFFNRKNLTEIPTRVVFFMYLESLNTPISSPYGDLLLNEVHEMPQRLSRIILYEPMD